MLCKRFADCVAFFLFKIVNVSFSGFQRNAQPLPPAMISGVFGICHQQAFSRNSGGGISAKYAILRKIALLACYTVIQTRHIYQTDILRYSFASDIIYSEVWTMELRVLNYFLAIAREENFTKAPHSSFMGILINSYFRMSIGSDIRPISKIPRSIWSRIFPAFPL